MELFRDALSIVMCSVLASIAVALPAVHRNSRELQNALFLIDLHKIYGGPFYSRKIFHKNKAFYDTLISLVRKQCQSIVILSRDYAMIYLKVVDRDK